MCSVVENDWNWQFTNGTEDLETQLESEFLLVKLNEMGEEELGEAESLGVKDNMCNHVEGEWNAEETELFASVNKLIAANGGKTKGKEMINKRSDMYHVPSVMLRKPQVESKGSRSIVTQVTQGKKQAAENMIEADCIFIESSFADAQRLEELLFPQHGQVQKIPFMYHPFAESENSLQQMQTSSARTEQCSYLLGDEPSLTAADSLVQFRN